jgi:hypothetical protein
MQAHQHFQVISQETILATISFARLGHSVRYLAAAAFRPEKVYRK